MPDVLCGRPTETGTPCQVRRGRRAPACRIHLTPQEKEYLTIRREVEAEFTREAIALFGDGA